MSLAWAVQPEIPEDDGTMRPWIAISLCAVTLVGANGVLAESPSTPTPEPTTASVPSLGVYESLSPGNKRVAVALFEAQKTSAPDVTLLTLDQIAQERRSGKSWGDVFLAMKSQGQIQAETLAQVLGRYNRARHTRN